MTADDNVESDSALAESIGRREKLLDEIMRLTLDLIFKDNPDDMIEELGRTVMDLLPIRSMIIYVINEKGERFVPKRIFGYPEEHARRIRDEISYDVQLSTSGKYHDISKPIGRFSRFYRCELLEEMDEREVLTALDQEEIERPRKDENSWHALDTADIPLRGRDGREIGDISITGTSTGRLLDYETIEALEILASISSVALELTKLGEKEHEITELQEQRAKQMSQILTVTSSILTLTTDPYTLMDRILELLEELFGFKSGAIALFDESEGVFKWKVLRGYSEEKMARAYEIRIPKEIIANDTNSEYRIGYLAHFIPAEKVIAEDLEYFFFTDEERLKALSYLSEPRKDDDSWHALDDLNFPIFDRSGRTIGVLSPDNPEDGKIPSRELLEIIEIFVSLTAIALENANLYSQTLVARDEIHTLNRLMFHDLMNYGLAIRGYIELAKESDEKNSEIYIRKALSQIAKTEELINKIKKVSTIRSTDRRNLVRIDLNRTIRGQATRSAELFPTKEVTYKFDLGEVDAFVMANDLLPDLFHNIFINAIKFDLHNQVKIEVVLKHVTEDIGDVHKRYWQITIADHGPGIPDDRKDMIFTESTRLSSTMRGMGLGLSIVKSLVDLYRGEIWIEDRKRGNHKKGAVFIVQLPAA